MTKYARVASVTDIGKEVIAAHHPHLTHVRVDFVVRDNTPTANGKERWGSARKIGGLTAFLADSDEVGDEFFLIEIAGPVWNTLSSVERRALIDHELCHCHVELMDPDDSTSDLKLTLKKHDFEEFNAIIERHGLWRKDAEAMAATIDSVLEP